MNRSEFKEITKLSDEADEKSRKHLKQNKDWKLYREDIKANGQKRAPGNASQLGNFTVIRHQQLAIQDKINAEDRQANVHTRASKAEGIAVDRGDDMNMEDVSVGGDTERKDSSDMDYEEMEESLPSLASSAELGKVLTQHSEHSASDPRAFPQATGEDLVNFAAINFLSALTVNYPGLSLDWNPQKYKFTTQLGAASIRAITDGCLCPRGGGDSICAIVEVKPFVLLRKPDEVFMQMGIEMLAWILSCEQTEKRQKRYFMVSQHRHEIFLVVAKFDREYIRYFEEHPKFDPEVPSFLHLYCSGPFNIHFDAGHMFTIGRIIMTLTLQLSMDWCDSTKTSDPENFEGGEPV